MSKSLEELNALVDAAAHACMDTGAKIARGFDLSETPMLPEVAALRAALAEVCAERDTLRDYAEHVTEHIANMPLWIGSMSVATVSYDLPKDAPDA